MINNPKCWFLISIPESGKLKRTFKKNLEASPLINWLKNNSSGECCPSTTHSSPNFKSKSCKRLLSKWKTCSKMCYPDYHQPQSSRETTLTADRRRGRLKEWAWTKWLKRSWRLPRDKRGSKERPLICNKTVTSMRARGISVQPRKEPLLPLETGHLCNWQTIFWGTANTWGRL